MPSSAARASTKLASRPPPLQQHRRSISSSTRAPTWRPLEPHSSSSLLTYLILGFLLTVSFMWMNNLSFTLLWKGHHTAGHGGVPSSAVDPVSNVTTAFPAASVAAQVSEDPCNAAIDCALRSVAEFYAAAGDFHCPQPHRYTREEVALHSDEDDLWIVVHGNVLDVSGFARQHPGGDVLLDGAGGRDMEVLFTQFHGPSAVSLFASFCIGRVASEVDAKKVVM